MQKVTEFLERYVQWIVLGCCLLFLGYMGYSYWVVPPAPAKIGGKPVYADQINDEILNGPVKQIEMDLPKEAPSVKVKDHASIFISDMGFQGRPEFASIYKPLEPWKISKNARDVTDDSGPAVVNPDEKYKVAAMPKVPAPTDLSTSTGRMLANLDTLAKNAAVVAAAAPEKPAKKRPNDAADKAAAKTRDMDWASLGAVIPGSDLEDLFSSAFKEPAEGDVPLELFSTRVLKVELHRQEKMIDGSWSKADVIIPVLEMYKMLPLPKADAKQQESYEFIEWAMTHPEYIATPAFYEAAKGKPWQAPGEVQPGGAAQPVVAAPANAAPFDPAHPPKNRKLTPEERKMIADYKKSQRQQRGGPGMGPAGFPGMMPGGMPRPGAGGKARPYFQSAPPVKTSGKAAPRQGGYPGPMPPGMMMPPGYGRPGMMPPGYGPYGRPGMMPPGMMPPGMMPPGMQPGARPGNFNQQGSGLIDVHAAEDVKLWAHDETVQPGKTYRYSIRYYLLNPLFATPPNIECDAKWKQLLWLESPMSEWSEPVHVNERVNFWLTKMTSSAASFDVFEWKNDSWSNHVKSVGPGDQIPGTSWTVADIRKDVKGQYVLIVNETGTVERRDLKSDSESSEYQEMKDEAAASKVTQ